MSRALFNDLLAAGMVLLDGASGTQLQAAGMPAGAIPEIWLLENQQVLVDLQTAYMQAGSQIIYTFTFGANGIKLAAQTEDPAEVALINQQLAAVSLQARADFLHQQPDKKVLVAGDLAPTGLFLKPAGELDFEQLITIYKQQVKGLLAAGVDLFIIETMLDLAQARAAVLAVKESCDLPVLVSMTLEENGRTLSGNTPLSCLLALLALGIDAFGLNCSFGPDRILEHILPLKDYSPVPLFVKPNAGMPQLIENKTVFNMDAASFAQAMQPGLTAGLGLIGGCCGTGPDHINALQELLSETKSLAPVQKPALWPDLISSSRQCLAASDIAGLPTILAQDPDSLIDDIMDALEDDPAALMLDFNSWPAKNKAELPDLMQELQLLAPLPLIFATADASFTELILRNYHGRAGLLGQQSPPAYGALTI